MLHYTSQNLQDIYIAVIPAILEFFSVVKIFCRQTIEPSLRAAITFLKLNIFQTGRRFLTLLLYYLEYMVIKQIMIKESQEDLNDILEVLRYSNFKAIKSLDDSTIFGFLPS